MATHVVVKKQKFRSDHSYLDLDSPEVQGSLEYLTTLMNSLPVNLEPLRPLLSQLVAEQVTQKENVSMYI